MASQGVESVQSINHRDDNIEVEMIEIDGDNHEKECATLETDDIRPHEKCKYCKIHLKAPPGFGTTGLFKHYQKACKRRPRGLDIRQSLIKTSKKVNGAEELTTHIFSQEYTRSEVARMVILHDYPLSIVEHVGFRRYSASLQPSFTMISRNTLKNDIFSIYNDEKVKFYKLLEKLKCRVAITTDMWTASNNKKGFMAITAHFIDDSFVYVPAPHTADVLCDLLANALMDCNIDRKVSTITVDNCTTNDAMLRRLLDRLPTKDMLLDGKVLHMRCCAHILNLIVKDGLETISSTIERIHDSVVYWTASPARVEKFEKVARQLNDMEKDMLEKYEKYWDSCHILMGVAAVLDPRLHPSTLEALMCARRWLWNEGNGTSSKFSGLEACPTMLDEEEDEESFVET
ncbi:hypothetical protein BUALT_Bualt07G0093900 [Buddleja alternifolia]|uniref:hAT-like transposase RNase-H fold domain-containing protein n=1 Tax=Buddleja alternifolia TaxID=168488 RepID=A0AAV6XDV7_9LAMI|nr:hypothetical protein BUALT_Bualt07G0093900 [Buddleja alternifolia]